MLPPAFTDFGRLPPVFTDFGQLPAVFTDFGYLRLLGDYLRIFQILLPLVPPAFTDTRLNALLPICFMKSSVALGIGYVVSVTFIVDLSHILPIIHSFLK